MTTKTEFKATSQTTNTPPTPNAQPARPTLSSSERYALAVMWKIIGRDYNVDQLVNYIRSTEDKRKNKKYAEWETGFVVLASIKDISLKFASGWIRVDFKIQKGMLNTYFKKSGQLSTHKKPVPVTREFAIEACRECPYLQGPPQQEQKTKRPQQLSLFQLTRQ